MNTNKQSSMHSYIQKYETQRHVEESSEALQILQCDGTSSLQADEDVLSQGKNPQKPPESLNAGICVLRENKSYQQGSDLMIIGFEGSLRRLSLQCWVYIGLAESTQC